MIRDFSASTHTHTYTHTDNYDWHKLKKQQCCHDLAASSPSSYGHQGKLCLLATSACVLCACAGTCMRPGNSCCNKSVAAPSAALGFQLGEQTFGGKVLTWEFVGIWIWGEDSDGGLQPNLLINLTHWLSILLYAVVYLTEMWVKKKETNETNLHLHIFTSIPLLSKQLQNSRSREESTATRVLHLRAQALVKSLQDRATSRLPLESSDSLKQTASESQVGSTVIDSHPGSL